MCAKRLSDEATKANVTPDLIAEALAVYTEDKGKHQRTGMAIARNQQRYETQGVSPKLIRQMYRERDLTDDERATEYADEMRYRRALDLIEFDKKGQGTFAAAMDAPAAPKGGDGAMKLTEARAYNDGFNSAMHGKGAINRHIAGSPEHAAFARGKKDGLEEKDKIAGSPAKRGRPAATTVSAVDAEILADGPQVANVALSGRKAAGDKPATTKRGKKNAAAALDAAREHLSGDPLDVEGGAGLLN